MKESHTVSENFAGNAEEEYHLKESTGEEVEKNGFSLEERTVYQPNEEQEQMTLVGRRNTTDREDSSHKSQLHIKSNLVLVYYKES